VSGVHLLRRGYNSCWKADIVEEATMAGSRSYANRQGGNFYWPNMEIDVRRYCNECDKCQRTKAPRHAKHRLFHPLEMTCKPWTHISTYFIMDLPESEGATMILVVVDRFTKMAHFVPIKEKDSPTVAQA
jgi:hypothetical protein